MPYHHYESSRRTKREGVVKARIVVAVFYQARMLCEKLPPGRLEERSSKETPAS